HRLRAGPALRQRGRQDQPAPVRGTADLMRQQRQRMICLDFSRDRLTALEVADQMVSRWFARPLGDDIMRNGDPTDPAALGGLVRQSLAMAGIETRRARIALPDEATVSRVLTMPAMPQKDLVRAMRYAAERSIPFPIDSARWSWDVV